jgi:hypothetical protein
MSIDQGIECMDKSRNIRVLAVSIMIVVLMALTACNKDTNESGNAPASQVTKTEEPTTADIEPTPEQPATILPCTMVAGEYPAAWNNVDATVELAEFNREIAMNIISVNLDVHCAA